MKVCPKCGNLYTDDNMFCEACGSKLMFQMAENREKFNPDGQVQGRRNQGMQSVYPVPKKKKVNPLFFAIPIVVIIILLALFFLFRDKLPFGKKEAAAQETVREETSDSVKSATDKTDTKEDQEAALESDSDETKSDSEESGSETEISDKESAEKEELSQEGKTDYSDSDINGIDNAYIQAVGTVARESGRIVLKLQNVSSVCAYNAEDEIIQKEKVESFLLDGSDMEEYLGDTVEIKGKLTADFDRNFSLNPVKTEVKRQAEEEMPSNSRYQLIQADVTWEEAFSDCISRGGALVKIDSEEEFKKITDLIEEQGMQSIHFYLGGRRDADSQSYYWADADNQLEDELLNPQGQSWAVVHWMENEPSFTSEGDTELYLNLIYYKENWVLNDVPSDITQYYPGKTGYICEFKE